MMATKTQVFTSSGTFNVPSNVSLVFLTANAGGGGGGGTPIGTNDAANGAGASEACFNCPVKVTPGDTITVTIGDKGVGSAGIDGTDGGNTTFGNITLYGGEGGPKSSQLNARGGNGGGVGGASGLPSSPTKRGVAENSVFYGGAAGGESGSPPLSLGGPAGPYLGGVNGATIGAHPGGGGGAASTYGSGGKGGDGGEPGGVGGSSSVSAYGAGGAGSGAYGGAPFHAFAIAGGNGTKGYVIVMWAG